MPNKSLFARLGYILLGALLLHLLWATLSLVMQKALLPTPWAVYTHMPTAWQEGMAGHLTASLGRIGVGLALALLIALIIALAMHRYRHFGKVFDAFIYFSYPIPKLALLPIVMLLGGLGESTKIIMILLIVLFQLIVSLRDALAAIPKDNYTVMHSLGAGHAAPSFTTGSCTRPAFGSTHSHRHRCLCTLCYGDIRHLAGYGVLYS